MNLIGSASQVFLHVMSLQRRRIIAETDIATCCRMISIECTLPMENTSMQAISRARNLMQPNGDILPHRQAQIHHKIRSNDCIHFGKTWHVHESPSEDLGHYNHKDLGSILVKFCMNSHYHGQALT